MSCYKWELEAILEGLLLKNVDDREQLAELAANMRYTLHAKKINSNKLFDKKSEERRVKEIFNKEEVKKQEIDLAEKVRHMNEHFRNKNKKTGGE